MKRVAIIAEHGIGHRQPYTHALAFAEALREQLAASTGRAWNISRFFPTVAEGTLVADLPSFAIRLTSADLGDDDTVYDIVEPSWANMTKGYVDQNTMLGSLRAALRTTATSLRRWSCKTFVEQAIVATLIAGGFTAAALPFIAAMLFVNRHVTGYSFLEAILLALVVVTCASLFGKCVLIGLNTAAYFKDFKSWLTRNGDLLLPLRLIFAHLEASNNGWRPYSVIGFGRTLSTVLLLSLVLTAALTYSALRHFQWTSAITVSDLGLLLVAATGPLVLQRLARVASRSFGSLEDIYTFCNFRSPDAVVRRESVVARSAQAIIDALQLVDLGTKCRYYNEVHLFGHSMGSYIGLRSLSKLVDAVESGALSADDFRRIRSFTTYGAPIDKIAAHFGIDALSDNPLEVINATIPTHILGKEKISWMNLYYATDIVSDPVTVYNASVCRNILLQSPLTIWSHSSYAKDPSFWSHVLSTQLLLVADNDNDNDNDNAADPRSSFASRAKAFFGRLDTAPISDSAGALLAGGLLRVWAFIASLIVALWIIGHVRSGWGLSLGLLFPFLSIALIQLMIKETANAKGDR